MLYGDFYHDLSSKISSSRSPDLNPRSQLMARKWADWAEVQGTHYLANGRRGAISGPSTGYLEGKLGSSCGNAGGLGLEKHRG